ncbi:MAG: hypothetical protein AB7I19_05275 [Planctomycetota bacterium]
MSPRSSAQSAGFRLALRLLTPALWVSLAITGLLALYGAWMQSINASDRMDTRVWWLQTALAVMAITLVFRAIDVSPQWGRERADGQWLRRRRIGGADGTLPIALALLCVMEIGVIVLTPIFELVVRHGRPASVAERLAIEPVGLDRLDARNPRLEFRLPEGGFAELELRPSLAAASLQSSLVITVAIEQDGSDVGAPRDYGLTDTVLRIPLQARCRSVALRRLDGDLGLEFPLGSAHAIQPAIAPRWLAAIGAASCLIIDWLPVLAGLALARRVLSVGILKVLAIAAHLALLIGGRGTQSAALSAHGRDAWFWTAHTRGTAVELVVASVVLVALTLLGERLSAGNRTAPDRRR